MPFDFVVHTDMIFKYIDFPLFLLILQRKVIGFVKIVLKCVLLSDLDTNQFLLLGYMLRNANKVDK